MTTTAADTGTITGASWLRITLAGIVLAIVGLLMMGLAMLFGQHTENGPYEYPADYLITAAALPHGVGLFLTVLGYHRLQRGRDGMLGRIGVWLYGICMAELVIQCMASLVAGEELIWGPAYPVAAVGLMVGLVLIAASSWNVGLLPTWMLAIWPPLGLLGSFLGIGPIPLLFAIFLGAIAYLLPRRARALDGR